jgi:hypothetical protein
MTIEQQRQQAEDKREAAERQRETAESKRHAAEEERHTAEGQRHVSEEVRLTAAHVREAVGADDHTSLEGRVTRIEAHLSQLAQRLARLEEHLLRHVEKLHQETRAQEAKNTEHIVRVHQIVENGKQKVKDTQQLIERAQDTTRNFLE